MMRTSDVMQERETDVHMQCHNVAPSNSLCMEAVGCGECEGEKLRHKSPNHL